MTGRCPHCGATVSMSPEVNGKTIVHETEEKIFVVAYPSGYVKEKRGYLVHRCRKTGEDGHVVR